eukprot:COSAG01_NODE_60305_length_295_cov_1.306122_2_plen_50_part_01
MMQFSSHTELSTVQPASATRPPKIDLVVCVGIFCGACMYVVGVGRSEKNR